jgi:hypothetical protein
MRTQRAVIDCAYWLKACLELGWRKSDLDFLEALWWQHHDDRGELRAPELNSTNDPWYCPKGSRP